VRLKHRASTFVRWVFWCLCWMAEAVGHTMVTLASAFKACRRATSVYAPLVIPAQLVLLLAWVPTRLLFLLLYRAAKGAYRVDLHLGRAVAVAE
jgi:hypothetical protein